MADYYTHMTAEGPIPCTKEDYEELLELLKDGDEDEPDSGIQLSFSDAGVYLYSEMYFDSDEIPESFLNKIGELLAAAKVEYLTCGMAFTCTKMRPESHGGNDFRIYPDGQLVFAEKVFDHTPGPLVYARATWNGLQKENIHGDYPGYDRSDWRGEVVKGDTQLGYWDWVWHGIESNGS